MKLILRGLDRHTRKQISFFRDANIDLVKYNKDLTGQNLINLLEREWSQPGVQCPGVSWVSSLTIWLPRERLALLIIPTSLLLLKTSIKFYNGPHLWLDLNRVLQRNIEIGNERKCLGNYPIIGAHPQSRFIFLETNQQQFNNFRHDSQSQRLQRKCHFRIIFIQAVSFDPILIDSV